MIQYARTKMKAAFEDKQGLARPRPLLDRPGHEGVRQFPAGTLVMIDTSRPIARQVTSPARGPVYTVRPVYNPIWTTETALPGAGWLTPLSPLEVLALADELPE